MKKIPHIDTLKNILITRCEGSLGDAILSSGTFREIKRVKPQIKITVACYGNSYDFLKANPYIDEVFKLPVRTRIRRHQRWPSLIWAGLQLRRRKFDLIIDSSDKSAPNWRLCKWLAGGNRILDVFHVPQLRDFQNQHGSEFERTILKFLGIKNPSMRYDLPIEPSVHHSMAKWLAQNKLTRYIVFNPFGSVSKRSFNSQTIEHLHTLLLTWKIAWVVPLAPAAYETGKQLFVKFSNVFVVQTKNVFELFALICQADAVITPDTSVVHIATGFEKPTLAFYNCFGPHFAPNNPQAYVIKTAPYDINASIDWKQVEKTIEQMKSHLPQNAKLQK